MLKIVLYYRKSTDDSKRQKASIEDQKAWAHEYLKNIKTATIGTYSDSVMNLQKFLAQKGFYTGDIDGIMTIEVLRALRAYQSDKGIGQTGRIDLATQIQIEKDLGL